MKTTIIDLTHLKEEDLPKFSLEEMQKFFKNPEIRSTLVDDHTCKSTFIVNDKNKHILQHILS